MGSKIFFFGMDNVIESEIINCVPCQATGQSNPPSMVQPTKIPRYWKKYEQPWYETLLT